MDIPKTSLKDKYIKVKNTEERKVKHLDSLYSTGFLNDYFSHKPITRSMSGNTA
uniref:Uncharacterized protein n=1 Tax=viral metagenome TaxID=1070528 RepID=A0A6C0BW04_9ZZZZ